MKDLSKSPATPTGATERRRIPMSVPVQKLEVADIPGYHLHWFNGNVERVQRAFDGGYEFVLPGEVSMASSGLGTTSAASGNTDMGSQVSIVSGQELGKDGQPLRMVLMKIKQEWYDEDQKVNEARNEKVRASLLGGLLGSEREQPGDVQHRYVKQATIPDFFKHKRPRAA